MKRRFLLPIVALLLMSSCMRPNKEPGLSVEGKAMDTLSQKNYEYISTLRLTVSESKRLIAKGIAVNKEVRERLENGMVIITLGTTNTYIAEISGVLLTMSLGTIATHPWIGDLEEC